MRFAIEIPGRVCFSPEEVDALRAFGFVFQEFPRAPEFSPLYARRLDSVAYKWVDNLEELLQIVRDWGSIEIGPDRDGFEIRLLGRKVG